MAALDLNSIQSQATPGVPSSPGEFIHNLLPYALGAAGILLLIYMVLGGLEIMTSKGEPKAIQAAQAKITNGIIGFVIIAISAGVVVLLGKILNVPIFSQLF